LRHCEGNGTVEPGQKEPRGHGRALAAPRKSGDVEAGAMEDGDTENSDMEEAATWQARRVARG